MNITGSGAYKFDPIAVIDAEWNNYKDFDYFYSHSIHTEIGLRKTGILINHLDIRHCKDRSCFNSHKKLALYVPWGTLFFKEEGGVHPECSTPVYTEDGVSYKCHDGGRLNIEVYEDYILVEYLLLVKEENLFHHIGNIRIPYDVMLDHLYDDFGDGALVRLKSYLDAEKDRASIDLSPLMRGLGYLIGAGIGQLT